jgi:transcriptional regulator with XRE-family HTH domain
MLRSWRQRRRFSQLEMGAVVGVSAKHLSFVETGRSRPSREMVLHLLRCLEVPLRDSNAVLLAAGYSPEYREALVDSPSDEVSAYIDRVLLSQRYPSVVVDGRFDIHGANRGAAVMMEGVAAHLLKPTPNLLAIGLDDAGLAHSIVNFDEYASHVVRRVRHIATRDPEPGLLKLLDAYGHLAKDAYAWSNTTVLPLVLRLDVGTITLFSTSTTFAMPREVHLSELAIETFYPADPESAGLLDRLIEGAPWQPDVPGS